MFNSIFDRKHDEDLMRSEGRLPPGQSLTQKFPVLHNGPVPHFNPAVWDLSVWGEVKDPHRWNWEEFNQLPRTKVKMDIHCVTRWSKFDTEWEGVSVRTLLETGLITPLPSAKFVLQHAEFGYTTNLPLEVILAENFLMATHYNGQPISPEHGYPLRGVVGARIGEQDADVPYLWKGAKWLRGLEFLANDKRGFWELAGYHNHGDVWKEERFG